ncbi:hypothetical protein [Curtobacterium sp. MCBD17_040]|uniref:hypothetical protein n=1 Tax=Curtobacterium sp. MCBD17_040 TaxID=2175674 RepID=UPI000DA7B816|nr:hypothetical protein [Curtobacterium sp. MCBD17_040]WIB65938.1 hypothetical protein DEI94_17645 [Curtobacterium sp. MCBD17_040]
MGDTEAERKARARKRRRKRRSRAQWRQLRDWRGQRPQPLAWYIVVLATGLGIFYGLAAGPGDTGADGLGVVLAGLVGGIVFGGLLYGLVPPVFANLAVIAGLFAGMITVGPNYPGAMFAGLPGLIVGVILGAYGRYLALHKRRPPIVPLTVDRTKERRPVPMTAGARVQLYFTIGSVVLLVALPAFIYLVVGHAPVLTWALLTLLGLAWAVPAGWWSWQVSTKQLVGGTGFNAALFGTLINAYAAASVHALPLVLYAGIAGVGIGALVRQLYEAKVGRYPRARPPKPTTEPALPDQA